MVQFHGSSPKHKRVNHCVETPVRETLDLNVGRFLFFCEKILDKGEFLGYSLIDFIENGAKNGRY